MLVFQTAVYGWKFGLLSGRVHLGDKSMLLRKTGVKKTDIICAQWKSKTHLPAHFVLRDVRRKTIVLCIRGTLSPKDILTDLCCTAEDFGSHEEILRETADDSSYRIKYNYRGRAHQGMLESARGVAEATRKLIASELASKPDYDLVIVGHSLGKSCGTKAHQMLYVYIFLHIQHLLYCRRWCCCDFSDVMARDLP